METTATDGSLMGLGVSRSVPSSPGERSPSDKFNPATSGSATCSPSGHVSHVSASDIRYSNKPCLPAPQHPEPDVDVPHINVWATCDSDPCHVAGDTDTGVWSSDQDTSAQVSASSVFCRRTTLESPCYQPSPHHRHPYHSVPSQPSMTSPSPPASPRHRQPQQWPVLGSSTDTSSRYLARSSTEESHGSRGHVTRSSTEESPHSPDRHTDTCNCRSRVTFGPIHVSPLSSPGGVESSEMMTTIRTATPQPTLPSDLSEHLTP